MSVPVVRYFFRVFNSIDAWGIETLFMALGLGVVFYLVRDRQRSPWISGLSAFFAVCTAVGISYMTNNSWKGIFLSPLQFVLAVFVMAGYYFLYKNCLLCVIYIYEKKLTWFVRGPSGKIEQFLFEKHTFSGPLLFVLVCGFPWLIFYFPGTLQWDAHAQLWQYFGVVEKTGHYPVFMTEWMGACIHIGRRLFHSDSIGLFLFTGPQFLCQCLTFAYASHVMSRRRVPVFISWGSLLFWSVYPYFPMWGLTMVKDTFQYISVLLLVIVMVEILGDGVEGVKWYQAMLFLVSVAGISLSRNDGRYVVLITMFFAIIFYRKYWKLFTGGTLACILLVGVQSLYMSYNQIPQGEIGEMLSIPLQQTARYLKEYPDDVTEQEAEILQRGFTVSLDQLDYVPTISDEVKKNFLSHPDREYLKEYFYVWFQQLLRHPDSYIQAFINQTYGYFYPNVHNHGDYIEIFYIGNSDHWQDGYLDIKFAIETPYVRRVLEHTVYLVERMPVISMFLSAGTYVYIILAEFIFLFRRRRKAIIILIPGLCVVLISIASPVNGYLRYMMPVMVTMPISLAWCNIVQSGGMGQNSQQKKTETVRHCLE